MRVLLALDDRALGEVLVDALRADGLAADVRAPLDATPDGGVAPAVVLVDADRPAFDLAVFAAAWSRVPAPPVLFVLTATAGGRATAARLGASVITKPFSPEWLASELAKAAEASKVTPLPRARPAARGTMAATSTGALAALGLAAGGLPEDEAAAIAAGSRRVALEVVREALRPLSGQYLTPAPLLDTLCARRALTDAEARFATTAADGAHTTRWLIDSSPLGQEHAARLLWGLVCGGALTATVEPRADGPKALGRLCARVRAHLRARYARVRGADVYAVLELDHGCHAEDAERAALCLSIRYAPERLSGLDLGELEPLAAALWKQILEARATVCDADKRRAYDAFRGRAAPEELRAKRLARDEAEQSFLRGQRALVAGDAFRAVSELAAAARRYGDEPDYDAWAAWARVLADRARGGDAARTAVRERAAAENAMLGRRPSPRGLLALGLICEAAGDADFARLHLKEVLALDPRQVAAREGLARLGG